MIFVFAKTPDDNLARLVKKLDEVVAANQQKKLAAVVNFTADTGEEFAKKVRAFGEENHIQNVALTVTADAKRFHVSDEVAVTVMHYRGKKVKFNFSADPGGLDDQAIESILHGVETILD